MRKLIIAACIMVYLSPVKSQSQQNATENYWNYHDLICKAEIAFYLNNNVDSCLYYYNNELISEIKQNGFPSNKIIGIDDATIFSETGNPELDLNRRVEQQHDDLWRKEMRPEETYKVLLKPKQYSDSEKPALTPFGNDIDMVVSIDEPIPAGYRYGIDDRILSNNFIIVLLYHRGCSYSELRDIMLEEIAKGNFHPREFGFVYDRQYEASLEIWGPMHTNCPQLIIEDGIFRISSLLSYFEVEPQEKVNALRAKYHIAPLEVDNMKRYFEDTHGFKLFWGFWDCL